MKQDCIGIISFSKTHVLLLLVFVLALSNTFAIARTKAITYDYSIVGVAIAKEGYYLVEVSAMANKKKEATIDLAKKCAIHGVLFKGFVVDGISQKPIMFSPSDEDKHSDYFKNLINNKYNIYTTCNQPIHVVKVGKKYRVTTVVVVTKDLLRKDLETSGIIRKLGL